MKLCMDCKHYRYAEVICGFPHTREPIYGSVVTESCLWERSRHGKCGPEGRLWEPKPKPVPLLKRAARWIGDRPEWMWRTK